MNAVKMLFNNLTKPQRIGLLFVLQFLVVIMIVSVIFLSFSDKEHVEMSNENGILSQVPDDILDNFKETLWGVIKKNQDVDKSVVDDIVIREDSYKEIVEEESKSINFLIDIDSVKQTYVISIGWDTGSEGDDTSGINIGCPPISQMKYKETFCQGMYDNTNSFSLYFPHVLYGKSNGEEKECGVMGYECEDDYEDEDDIDEYKYDTGMLYHIDGDEYTKTIIIESSNCNVEEYNQKALDYLKNYTPFYNNSEYIIKYKINNTDVICGRS